MEERTPRVKALTWDIRCGERPLVVHVLLIAACLAAPRSLDSLVAAHKLFAYGGLLL